MPWGGRLPLRQTAGLWEAVRDREPVYIADLEGDSPLAQAWRAPALMEQRRLAGNARSYLAVPIVVKGEPVGILRLTDGAPVFPEPSAAA